MYPLVIRQHAMVFRLMEVRGSGNPQARLVNSSQVHASCAPEAAAEA